MYPKEVLLIRIFLHGNRSHLRYEAACTQYDMPQLTYVYSYLIATL